MSNYLTFPYLTYSYLSAGGLVGEESLQLQHQHPGIEALQVAHQHTGIESKQLQHQHTGIEAFILNSIDLPIESIQMAHLHLGEQAFTMQYQTLGIEALQVAHHHIGTEGLQMQHQHTGVEAFMLIHKHLSIESFTLLAEQVGVEALQKIYNTTNIRVLCEFQSRGLVDQNWTVVQGGQAAGDFQIENVNTDIPEEVYRSLNQFVTLDCDVGKPQGVSPDTFVMWNHNLTSGAIVTMVASNDPTFSTGLYAVNMEWTKDNLYFITPLLDFPYPLARYYRFSIVDTDNTDGYIQIGNILFGSAVIFHRDCITANVGLRYREFKDEIPTEGFTNITNTRALKKAVTVEFRNLSFGSNNYTNLVTNVFLDARTSLRCVWIPYMEEPSRFGVFGKMTELPSEEHNVMGDANEDLDFVSFTVDIDESL